MDNQKKMVLSLLLTVLMLSSPMAKAASSEANPTGDEGTLTKQSGQTEARPNQAVSEVDTNTAAEDQAASGGPKDSGHSEAKDEAEASDHRDSDLAVDVSGQPETNEVVDEAAPNPGMASETTSDLAPDADGSDVTIPEAAPDGEKSAPAEDSVQAEDDEAGTNDDAVIEPEPVDQNKVEDAAESGTDAETTVPEAETDSKTEEIAAEGADAAEEIASEELAAAEEITAEEAAEVDAMVNEWLTARANAAETASTIPTTYDEVYNAMEALKEEYPEGKEWTNFTPYGKDGPLEDTYWWKGGPIKGASGGVGCAAFAFILSDHAFGDLPARTIDNGNFKYDDIRVGDILRVNNSHFVVVMQKSAGGVTVAEANYNKSVHWGRAMSVEEVMDSNFVVTRYPENFVPSDAEDADSIVQSGKEDALEWSLTKSGTLTVSGNGALRDYSPNDNIFPSWNSWKDSINNIVLKKGITGIGNYAFYQSKALSAYLADTIIRIGQSAFRDSNLVSITIPESVKEIGDDAFRGCSNLSSASISEGVERIGERAFQGDTSLKYVDFPSSITSIGAGAFASCENLIRVRFAPGTETAAMGANMFTECWHLQSVTLPQGLTALTPGMFSSCKLLYSLYIPKSVTSLTLAGEESPFTSSMISLIEYGGSEAEWNAMLNKNPYLRPTLQNVQVVFNVEFDDPFAAIPGDPGDIDFSDPDKPANPDEPGGSETPDNPDNPGGSETPDNPGGSETPDNPGGSETPDNPGGSETPDNPDNPGGSETPDNPDNPGGSETPDNPDNPGGSEAPDRPSGSESPSNPSKPNDSDHADQSPTNGDVETMNTGATEVQLSASMIDAAYERNEPVLLPIAPVKPVQGDFESAPSFLIQTGGKDTVAVAVPISAPTPSTVLAVVASDGTIKVIGKSALKDGDLIAVLQDGTQIKVIDNRKTFTDVVPGNPAEDAIAFVTARELLSGTTETTFSPEAPMTQAALLTAIARLDGVEASAGADITNVNDLEANVTAEQLILMLWKYCDAPVLAGAAENYTEESLVSKDVHDAMYWAVQNQIIDADFGTHTNLQHEITRAEAAQVLKNFVNTLNFVG